MIKFLSRFAHVTFILFVSAVVHAEALRFNTLNSSDGLPQNSIREIIQDQNGLMWFATEDGIVRYDGQETLVYRYDSDIDHPIPDNVINQILPQGDNRLWFSIQGEIGLSVLNQSTQIFSNVLPSPSLPNDVGSSVTALYEKSENEILIGSTNGVFSVSTNELTINKQLVSSDQLKNEADVVSIWEGPNANLWIASADGQLGYINQKETGSQTAQLNLINNELNSIFHVKTIKGLGDVVIAGRGGLLRIDYEQKTLVPLYSAFLQNKSVRDAVRAPSGEYWIATRSGLIRYNSSKQLAEIAIRNSEDENALPTHELTRLFISDDEMLWIGTTDKGVIRTNLKDYGFTSYSTHDLKRIYPLDETNLDTESTSFKNNMIWSLFRDSSSSLWIGHTEGISKQELGRDEYTNLTQVGTGDTAFDVSESWIMSIHETANYLWFGTWGEGLIRYSTKTNETVVYSTYAAKPEHTLSGDVIRLLLWDKERDSLWVGTHRSGLNQIHLSSGEITYYEPDDNDPTSFPHTRSRALYLDKKNQLWVGSGGGIALFNDDEKTFNLVSNLPEDETTSDVRGIFQSDDSTLWAANGYGLDKINISELKIEQRLLEKDGLSRSALYGIVPDTDGVLWIPTVKGLTRFDPVNNEFNRFFVDHNLQSNEFNFNASLIENDGSIIMGGVGGITKFHPDSIEKQYESKKPVILNIKALTNELSEEPKLGVTRNSIKDSFELQPNQRSVSIDFSIPEFTFQSDIRYEYRLVGNDENWISADSRDIPVRYTNLSPGNYEFQVRAVDGTEENNESVAIGFLLKPYLYERIWFRTLAAVLGLFALLHIFKNIYQHRIEKNISNERSNLYSMIVHDLGPSLKRSQEDIARISGLSSFENQNIFNDLNTENRYALSFIDQLRSLSTVEGYAKNQEDLFLLEDIWDESTSSLGMNLDRVEIGDIPDTSIRVFENSVQFVIKNLISNAIKYSKNHTPVHASLNIQEKDLTISITDQGFGMNDTLKTKVLNPYERGDMYSIEGLGLGLTLVKKIADKYRGSVSITDNQPTGSVVAVTLRGVVE